MNSFSAELYFEICIIVFIACFKIRISVFAILSAILLALIQKESPLRSLFRVILMACMLALDVWKTCIIDKMKRRGKSNGIV